MIARNDSARWGYFNGDGWYCASIAGSGLRVWFGDAGRHDQVRVQPSRLPEHDTTSAMTVHKSQVRI